MHKSVWCLCMFNATNVHVYEPTEARSWHWVFFLILSTLYHWGNVSVTEPGASYIVSLASQLAPGILPLPSEAGRTGGLAHHAICHLCEFWGSQLWSSHLMANIYITKPSPYPSPSDTGKEPLPQTVGPLQRCAAVLSWPYLGMVDTQRFHFVQGQQHL